MKKQKTYYAKREDKPVQWISIDATGQVLGRLASKIASIAKGKHTPSYQPSVDMGDFVVVYNAEKIRVTGRKETQKKYHRHSGYPGGITEISYKKMMSTFPERILYEAVKGMLPKNTIGRKMLKKVKIYAGNTHPHEAQSPTPLSVG